MARFQGRLIEWHDEKGYGFIQGITDERHTKVFLHIKSFKRSGPRPIEGCVLEYELGLDERSRPQALQVSYAKATQVNKKSGKSNPTTAQKIPFHPIYILMAVYWVTLLVASAFSAIPSFFLLMLSLVNAYTYWIYAKDKKAAQNNEQRVPEQHLLTMSLVGGWTAAWFAQQNLRHKTQKQPFKKYYQIMIGLNILLMIAIMVFYPSLGI